jgi:hypothetical protein
MMLRVFNYLILSAEITVPNKIGKVMNGELEGFGRHHGIFEDTNLERMRYNMKNLTSYINFLIWFHLP